MGGTSAPAKAQADVPAFIKEVVKLVRSIGSVSETDPSWVAERTRRIDELEKYVHLQIQLNLTGWKNEVDSAIDQAPYPAEPESRFYFYVALAGNLLWAATSLIAPEGAIAGILVKEATATEIRSQVIRLMSFTGASIGSGTVEQLFPGRSLASLKPADGKELIRKMVGIQRAALERIYVEIERKWATELDRAHVWDLAANSQNILALYDEHVWRLMFPKIAYDENRFNAIRERARDKAASALAEYNRQWQNWKNGQIFGPRPEALYAMGTLAQVPKTFTARLDFSVD